jgi:hypothetical protein
VGTFPTATITGFETVTLNGINQGGNGVAQTAEGDLFAAYSDIVSRTPTTTYGPICDLGGLTLTPGIYSDPSSFSITGILTLDGLGNPDAVWIFQAGSTLITAANSTISLIGGAQAGNIFWQVGSSATLGTGAEFDGNILAETSITVNSGVVDGRMLALNGAVTLDNAGMEIPAPVPEPNSLVMIAGGLVLLVLVRRWLQPAI